MYLRQAIVCNGTKKALKHTLLARAKFLWFRWGRNQLSCSKLPLGYYIGANTPSKVNTGEINLIAKEKVPFLPAFAFMR
jgi:hypothetical protein